MAEYCKECESLLIMGVCSNRKLHDPKYADKLKNVDKKKYDKAYKSDRPVIQDYVSERTYRGV